MNKHFSDYLPPALVRDFRRSIRTPWYPIMLGLCMVLFVWQLYSSHTGESVMNGGSIVDKTSSTFTMLALMGALMWVIIPVRACGSVSADARVKGTNFMMLTPLTSRQLVWGIWISACVQEIVVAGIALLIHWGYATIAGIPGDAENPIWLNYTILLCGGILMCTAFLFAAQLSKLIRTLLVLFTILSLINLVIFLLESGLLFRGGLIALCRDALSGTGLYLFLADAVMVILLLMEFARRSYAAPAENCSRSVRVLILLSLVSVPLIYRCCAEYVSVQLSFVTYYSLFACMSDALLPTYSLKGHDRRAWPFLPAYLQVPGIGQSAFFLLPVAAVLCWMNCAYLDSVNREDEIYWWLQLVYMLLTLLLITDLTCRRTNENRPAWAFLIFIVGAILSSLLPLSPGVLAALPFNTLRGELSSELFPITAGALVLVLCLLMSWRGRR